MTIKEYRESLVNHAAQIYGIKWNFLEDDLVRIIDTNDIYEVKFEKFTDLKNSLGLSKSFQEKEITSILAVKDNKFPHVIVLKIDVRPKEKEEKPEGGISAKMKYL